MEIFNKSNIQKYAESNTSPKLPIEKQYVNAFLDSLLNSKLIQEKYKILMDETQGGNTFWFYGSFWPNAVIVNKEPYRSIIAYSMLKKDMRLFELISASMFTGTITEYHGSDLYEEVVKTTDEKPIKYTDSGIFTDMNEGIIQIAFKNIFCDDSLDDGTGKEFQTLEELNNALNDFDSIITMTKPARVIVLLFYERYCFMGGDAEKLISCGINREYDKLEAPFGPRITGEPNTSMEIINSMSDDELKNCYIISKMTDKNNVPMEFSFERSVIPGADFLTFRYVFKTHKNSDDIWGKITIQSNISSVIYVIEKVYDSNKDHSQKYIPIVLKLRDNDPDSPILAFDVQNGISNTAALFYVHEKI